MLCCRVLCRDLLVMDVSSKSICFYWFYFLLFMDTNFASLQNMGHCRWLMKVKGKDAYFLETEGNGQWLLHDSSFKLGHVHCLWLLSDPSHGDGQCPDEKGPGPWVCLPFPTAVEKWVAVTSWRGSHLTTWPLWEEVKLDELTSRCLRIIWERDS